jgi:hypothetical protein
VIQRKSGDGNVVVCLFFRSCLRRVIDGEVAACRSLPGFNVTLTGGDGDDEQFCEHRFNLSVHVSLLNVTNNYSLCWILAYRVCGGGGSPRHKPGQNACPAHSQNTCNTHLPSTSQVCCSEGRRLLSHGSRPCSLSSYPEGCLGPSWICD